MKETSFTKKNIIIKKKYNKKINKILLLSILYKLQIK